MRDKTDPLLTGSRPARGCRTCRISRIALPMLLVLWFCVWPQVTPYIAGAILPVIWLEYRLRNRPPALDARWPALALAPFLIAQVGLTFDLLLPADSNNCAWSARMALLLTSTALLLGVLFRSCALKWVLVICWGLAIAGSIVGDSTSCTRGKHSLALWDHATRTARETLRTVRTAKGREADAKPFRAADRSSGWRGLAGQ